MSSYLTVALLLRLTSPYLAPVGISALFRLVAQQPQLSYVAIIVLKCLAHRKPFIAPAHAFRLCNQRLLRSFRFRSTRNGGYLRSTYLPPALRSRQIFRTATYFSVALSSPSRTLGFPKQNAILAARTFLTHENSHARLATDFFNILA